MTTLISIGSSGGEKKNIGRVDAGRGKMGIGSEVEAGGLDGMSRPGCGGALCSCC